MKKNLLLLLLFYSTILCGQDHNFDTSLLINKQIFKIQTKEIDPRNIALTIYRNTKIITVDTIDPYGPLTLEFPDFNNDGNKDIMLIYKGNPYIYNLYLFDRINNAFRLVRGLGRFPASQQLKTNSKYYFSYHQAGCGDLDWVSDLFLIDNFETVHVGQIHGKGCDFDPKTRPPVIEIYKLMGNTGNNKSLISKLPYQKNIPDPAYKWEFIRKYWEENYGAVSGFSSGK